MANHGCINGTLDGANYSSPMPLIGVYVAAASLVCLFLMIHDVVVAALARKRWLPSKFFGFNSATMTLLSVAVKLPVDLTTSMPTPQDQLSKLSGTVLICISMAYLMPSLGVNSDSERLTNMLGLSIFVVTVAVNICIQIYTGVIVLFTTEHMVVMGLMLLMLVMLWYISFHMNAEKRIANDQLNHLFARGNSDMFERLKLCLLYAFCSDPQYKISVHPTTGSVSTISPICAGILVQATIRSLILKKLKFCQGKSDYDWSILVIVVIQIFTVIVGTVIIVFRWLACFNRTKLEPTIVSILDDEDSVRRKQTLGKELARSRLLKFFASLFTKITSIIQLLLVSPWVLIRKTFNLYKHEPLEYFDYIHHEGLISTNPHMARKSVEDLIRLKKQVYPKKSLERLVDFLSKNQLPSTWCFLEDVHTCSLSIAFLVKIAQAAIPKNYLQPLLLAFNEAYGIIHFIDEKIQPLSSESIANVAYAKDLWRGGDFTCLLPDDITGTCPSQHGIQPEVDQVVAKITKFKDVLGRYQTYSKVVPIVDFINTESSYRSFDDLVKLIEQMFADMMRTLLSQLPIAIFKMIRDGTAEEFGERVRFAMELIYQTSILDGLIDWSFPISSGIESFVVNDSRENTSGPLARLVELTAAPRNHIGENSV